MTTRKTFSMPDELARAIEREAASRGRTESALVRESIEHYLASRSSSKLSLWVGKGRPARRAPAREFDGELVRVLEKKHPRAKRPRRG